MNPFKKGDTVKVIDNSNVKNLLQLDSIHTVESTDDSYVRLKHMNGIGGFWPNRFELVQQPTKQKPMCLNQPRQSNGRFASPKGTVSNSNKVSTLRNGSLYRVVGGPVARLRGNTFGDQVVMSVHNKPIVVKRDRLRIADKEDVQAYLADSKVS